MLWLSTVVPRHYHIGSRVYALMHFEIDNCVRTVLDHYKRRFFYFSLPGVIALQLKELKERQKQQLRHKAMKKGLDPE